LAILRPGNGSAAGCKVLAPPYYSQCAVFASLRALFPLFSFVVAYILLLANDDGFGALKQAAEDREGWRHRERILKPAVQN